MKIAGFGIEDWLNTWEKAAEIDIAQSTISSMTLREILDFEPDGGQAFMENLAQEKFHYGWIEGSYALKQGIATLYQRVPTRNILATNGATGANHLVCYSLLEPGDHVISEYPSYQQLYDIPRSLGAEVDLWSIYEDAAWYPRMEDLKSLIRPDTKLICLCNANNPTGTLLSTAFLKAVVDLAEKVGAYVLVDEVYQPLGKTEGPNPIADLYELGISTNSLSKTYSVPGIRLGWVATQSAQLADLFRKYRDYTMISCGVFDDSLGALVLNNKDKILARNRSLISHNLSLLKDWVTVEPEVSMVFPDHVSTSLLKFESLPPEKTEEFAIRLLKETGVLIGPGNRFDLPGYARIGYCCSTPTLQTGLKRLSLFLKKQYWS